VNILVLFGLEEEEKDNFANIFLRKIKEKSQHHFLENPILEATLFFVYLC
jgi:hypothetical protein